MSFNMYFKSVLTNLGLGAFFIDLLDIIPNSGYDQFEKSIVWGAMA